MSCESAGGSWEAGACDPGAVARCDAFGSTSWYYPAYLDQSGLTLDDLRQTCEDIGGDFTEL